MHITRSNVNCPQFLSSLGQPVCKSHISAFFALRQSLYGNKLSRFVGSRVMPPFPESQHRKVVSQSKQKSKVRGVQKRDNINTANKWTQDFLSLPPKQQNRALSLVSASAEQSQMAHEPETILPLVEKVNRRLSVQERRSKLFPTPAASRPVIAQDSQTGRPAEFSQKRFFYNKKNIATISVLSTRNNTLLTLSGTRGSVLKAGWASAGSLGFKNSRKSTTYAAQAAAKQLALKAKRQGIRGLHLRLRGMGRAKGAVVRTLQKCSLRILVIRESTPTVHNGCRCPKKRRI